MPRSSCCSISPTRGWSTKRTGEPCGCCSRAGSFARDPNFRFVSESFRRFVLSRIPAAEVAAIERRSTSAWDAVRLPFLITLLAVSAFFFLTQRELFTTTIAVITALAGGIPALVRVAGLFERQPESKGPGVRVRVQGRLGRVRPIGWHASDYSDQARPFEVALASEGRGGAMKIRLTSSGRRMNSRRIDRNAAIAPDTCGAAMLVPVSSM